MEKKNGRANSREVYQSNLIIIWLIIITSINLPTPHNHIIKVKMTYALDARGMCQKVLLLLLLTNFPPFYPQKSPLSTEEPPQILFNFGEDKEDECSPALTHPIYIT
jgi:hypothetical protein